MKNFFQSIKQTHSFHQELTKPLVSALSTALSMKDKKRSRFHLKGGRIPQESSECLQTLTLSVLSQLLNCCHDIHIQAYHKTICDKTKQINFQRIKRKSDNLKIPPKREHAMFSNILERGHFYFAHRFKSFLNFNSSRISAVQDCYIFLSKYAVQVGTN